MADEIFVDLRTSRFVARDEEPVFYLDVFARRDAVFEVFVKVSEMESNRVGRSFEQRNRLGRFDFGEREVAEYPL